MSLLKFLRDFCRGVGSIEDEECHCYMLCKVASQGTAFYSSFCLNMLFEKLVSIQLGTCQVQWAWWTWIHSECSSGKNALAGKAGNIWTVALPWMMEAELKYHRQLPSTSKALVLSFSAQRNQTQSQRDLCWPHNSTHTTWFLIQGVLLNFLLLCSTKSYFLEQIYCTACLSENFILQNKGIVSTSPGKDVQLFCSWLCIQFLFLITFERVHGNATACKEIFYTDASIRWCPRSHVTVLS